MAVVRLEPGLLIAPACALPLTTFSVFDKKSPAADIREGVREGVAGL